MKLRKAQVASSLTVSAASLVPAVATPAVPSLLPPVPCVVTAAAATAAVPSLLPAVSAATVRGRLAVATAAPSSSVLILALGWGVVTAAAVASARSRGFVPSLLAGQVGGRLALFVCVCGSMDGKLDQRQLQTFLHISDPGDDISYLHTQHANNSFSA